MPLYAFTCTKCNEAFESLVTSTSQAECPACGSSDLERQLSSTGVEGKSKAIKAGWRAQAAREGHTSNFKK